MPERIPVRVALAVDAKGCWNATGWSGATDDAEMMSIAVEGVEPGERRYFLTAWVEPPDVQVTEIAADVAVHNE